MWFLITFFWSSGTWAANTEVSGITVQFLIMDARVYLNDVTAWSGNTGDNTDQQLLRFFNDGAMEVVTRTWCLQTTETETLATGVSQYNISTDHIAIRAAIYSGSSITNKGLLRGNPENMGFKGEPISGGAGEPVAFWDSGTTIYFFPDIAESVSGNSVTLFLIERPVELPLESGVSTPACLDKALKFYIVKEGYAVNKRFDLSAIYEAKYEAEIERYKPVFMSPKQSEELRK